MVNHKHIQDLGSSAHSDFSAQNSAHSTQSTLSTHSARFIRSTHSAHSVHSVHSVRYDLSMGTFMWTGAQILWKCF